MKFKDVLTEQLTEKMTKNYPEGPEDRSSADIKKLLDRMAKIIVKKGEKLFEDAIKRVPARLEKFKKNGDERMFDKISHSLKFTTKDTFMGIGNQGLNEKDVAILFVDAVESVGDYYVPSKKSREKMMRVVPESDYEQAMKNMLEKYDYFLKTFLA